MSKSLTLDLVRLIALKVRDVADSNGRDFSFAKPAPQMLQRDFGLNSDEVKSAFREGLLTIVNDATEFHTDSFILGTLTVIRDWLAMETTQARIGYSAAELLIAQAAVATAIREAARSIPKPMTRKDIMNEIGRLSHDKRYASAFEAVEMDARIEALYNELGERGKS